MALKPLHLDGWPCRTCQHSRTLWRVEGAWWSMEARATTAQMLRAHLAAVGHTDAGDVVITEVRHA